MMSWVYSLILISWVGGSPNVSYVPLDSFETRAQCVRAGRAFVAEYPDTPAGVDQILVCQLVFEQEA